MQAFLSLSGKADRILCPAKNGQYVSLTPTEGFAGKRPGICFAGAGHEMMMPVGRLSAARRRIRTM